MASEALDKVIENIENDQNFILSGGAGSGKTFTLVQVIDYIYKTKSKPNVACIRHFEKNNHPKMQML